MSNNCITQPFIPRSDANRLYQKQSLIANSNRGYTRKSGHSSVNLINLNNSGFFARLGLYTKNTRITPVVGIYSRTTALNTSNDWIGPFRLCLGNLLLLQSGGLLLNEDSSFIIL